MKKTLNTITLTTLILLITPLLVQGLNLDIQPEQPETKEQETITLQIIAKNTTGNTTFTHQPQKGQIQKQNNTHATFTWTPTYGDGGTQQKKHEFTFKINDTNQEKQKEITITVQKINNPFNIIRKEGGGNTNEEKNLIEIETDRANATCKYDTQPEKYEDLKYTLKQKTETIHQGQINFHTDNEYTVYILCKDPLNNYIEEHEQIQFNVKLRPKAEIKLRPPSPVRQGLVEVTLTTTQPLIERPTLTYKFTGQSTQTNIVLVGSGTTWEGYLVIEESDIEKIGSFTYTGTSINNIQGNEIIKGEIFIVDSEAPRQVTSLKAENQNDRIKIEWHYPQELRQTIKEYRIYRRQGSGGTDYVDYYDSTTNRDFFDTDVEYNEAYYYRVSAVKKSGVEGPLSQEIFITHTPTRTEPATEGLSNVLRSELNQKIRTTENTLMDLESVERILRRETGKTQEIIEKLDLLGQVRTNIEQIQAELDKLKNLESQDLTTQEFDQRTKDIQSQTRQIFENTPLSIEIIDTKTYQENINDQRTKEIITEYLKAQQINTTTPEAQKYIDENTKLQDQKITEVETTLAQINYPEKNKKYAIIKKEINLQENTENAILLDWINPSISTNLRNNIYTETPTILQTRSILEWKFDNLRTHTYTYATETNATFEQLENTKTIILKNEIEEVRTSIITGKVVDVPQEIETHLVIATITILIIAVLLFIYYFYIHKEKRIDKKDLMKKIKEEYNNKKYKIMPEKKDEHMRLNIDQEGQNETTTQEQPQETETTNQAEPTQEQTPNQTNEATPQEETKTESTNTETTPERKPETETTEPKEGQYWTPPTGSEPPSQTNEATQQEETKPEQTEPKPETIQEQKTDETPTTTEPTQEQTPQEQPTPEPEPTPKSTETNVIKEDLEYLRNKLKEYKNTLDHHQKIPSEDIKHIHEAVTEIKKLIQEIHEDKLYNYAKNTKKELEETLRIIELQKKSDEILNKKEEKEDEMEKTKHTEELIEQIKTILKEAKQRGLTNQEIITKLQNVGYKEEFIKKYLEEIEEPYQPPTLNTPPNEQPTTPEPETTPETTQPNQQEQTGEAQTTNQAEQTPQTPEPAQEPTPNQTNEATPQEETKPEPTQKEPEEGQYWTPPNEQPAQTQTTPQEQPTPEPETTPNTEATPQEQTGEAQKEPEQPTNQAEQTPQTEEAQYWTPPTPNQPQEETTNEQPTTEQTPQTETNKPRITNAPPGKEFMTTENKKAHTIQELTEQLKNMNNENYQAHIKEDKNDFANWIEHVFEQKELAENIRKTNNKEELIQTLENYIKEIS